jgi:circadian clock protein KaiC
MMTSEVPDLFDARRLTEFAASHLADNVIMLSYYYDHATVKRALSVIKTRASGHDPAMREFAIDATGITINTTTAAGQPSAPSRATSADPA